MQFDPKRLDAESNYKLLTGIIVPRPIAWVTTLGSAGQVNAAPFSAFTYVSNEPPLIAISIGKKLGRLKDTARNIGANREFVVNIADLSLLDRLHASAVEHAEDVSEVELLRLQTRAGERVGTPRLSEAPVSMECVLHDILEFGVARSQLVIGEVVLFHVRDGLIADGKIETKKLDPICRLAGPTYAALGEVIQKAPILVTKHT